MHLDEAEIIAGLSMSLRMQVVMHLYREALEKVPLFKGKPPQFITSLVTYLKIEYYSPGEKSSLWKRVFGHMKGTMSKAEHTV